MVLYTQHCCLPTCRAKIEETQPLDRQRDEAAQPAAGLRGQVACPPWQRRRCVSSSRRSLTARTVEDPHAEQEAQRQNRQAMPGRAAQRLPQNQPGGADQHQEETHGVDEQLPGPAGLGFVQIGHER